MLTHTQPKSPRVLAGFYDYPKMLCKVITLSLIYSSKTMCLQRCWLRSIWEFIEYSRWDGEKDGGHFASHMGHLVLAALSWVLKTSMVAHGGVLCRNSPEGALDEIGELDTAVSVHRTNSTLLLNCIHRSSQNRDEHATVLHGKMVSL